MAEPPAQSSFSARATSSDSLESRLAINEKYGSANLMPWLLERLDVRSGQHILDVGCGTGNQTIAFADILGSEGSISAIDIAADSIDILQRKLKPSAPVQAVAGDMNHLDEVIATQFAVQTYDLVHSSYALYYAQDPAQVLDVMVGHLRLGGRAAIFTPNLPHGLVALAQRHSEVDARVVDSLSFGPAVLQPYFDAKLTNIAVHHFQNIVRVPTTEKLVEFYRATTYYDEQAEPAIRKEVDAEIDAAGFFAYEKNGFLIIGTKA